MSQLCWFTRKPPDRQVKTQDGPPSLGAAAGESTSRRLEPETTVAVSSPPRDCTITVINTALCNLTLLFRLTVRNIFRTHNHTILLLSPIPHSGRQEQIFHLGEKMLNSRFISQLHQVQRDMFMFESFLHFSPQCLSPTVLKIDSFAYEHYKNKSQSSLLKDKITF